MDAGWYGINTHPSPSEFEGDWGGHAGDWRVSPLVHPQGLKDVSEAAHQMGMKFLLWAEPERVVATTPIAREHPEYFFDPANEKAENRLLNLGLSEAWNYCYETLAHLIESIGIDCYRQDFNMIPLKDWRNNDTPERQGMSEILHINGLYRLWDVCLPAFPICSLIIALRAAGASISKPCGAVFRSGAAIIPVPPISWRRVCNAIIFPSINGSPSPARAAGAFMIPIASAAPIAPAWAFPMPSMNGRFLGMIPKN